MSKIKLLDEHLSNLIAAGEVVERPLNVVKECVENSIDANASRIEILLDNGGIDSITVRDNGTGMDFEDAGLAFERHATSKLKSQEDLFAIVSMGFRGEALPSIASVSQVELITGNGEEASRVVVEFGKRLVHERSSWNRGTQIQIKNLFTHTPARFKYLKKPAYEFSLISDCVYKLALAYPEISFVLKHNGKQVFQSRGNGKPDEILYRLYGKEIASSALPFEGRSDDYRIKGLAIHPSFSRANPYTVFISVNQRIIRSNFLVKALLKAYEEYLPLNRYPMVVLQIEADPQLFDVNVSPNKWQIRFSKENQLFSLIEGTVKSVLNEYFQPNQWIFKEDSGQEKGTTDEVLNKNPEGDRGEISGDSLDFSKGDQILSDVLSDQKERELPAREPEKQIFTLESRPEIKPHFQKKSPVGPDKGLRNSEVVEKVKPDSENLKLFDKKEESAQNQDFSELYYLENKPVQKEINKVDFLDELEVIGQYRDSYILCEGKDGLVIVDQHAAQERYHFEQLVDRLLEKPVLQPLMVPLFFETDPDLVERVESLNKWTEPYGLHFEEFDRKLILKQEPAWFSGIDKQSFVQDLFSVFKNEDALDVFKMRRKMIATAACHQSIRFNHALRLSEMKQVIEDLKKCRQPYHCPHGRPVLITLKNKDLIRQFSR